ncbi:MAG: hypothetical protein DWQ01_08445 [Planctomycetota bacterium]|nr:MAG: hypothetical protein DWQ01_08445 [Planctomycetota bacterium]
MRKSFILFGFIAAPLGILGSASLSESKGEGASKDASDKVSIKVLCGDLIGGMEGQGVVDADWHFEVSFSWAPFVEPTNRFKVPVPDGTGAGSAAALATKIINHHKPPWAPGDASWEYGEDPKTHTILDLPQGASIMGPISVTNKGGSSTSHFQVFEGLSKGPKGPLNYENLEGFFNGLTLSIPEMAAPRARVILILEGVDPGNVEYKDIYDHEHPLGSSAEDLIQGIGEFAESKGAMVSYPDGRSVHLDLGSMTSRLDTVEFCVANGLTQEGDVVSPTEIKFQVEAD